MKARILLLASLIGTLIPGPEYAYAAEPHSATNDLRLSPDLLTLLRVEMREVAGGVQGIALSIAEADWKSIQETTAKLRSSYIMEKQLTPANAAELDTALPHEFKGLDADFHERAEKLGAAAAAHDAELVVFHYSRLLEGCVACHSQFATSRFPAFSSAIAPAQHH